MTPHKKAAVVAYSALPADCLARLQQHFDVADFTGQSGLRKNPAFVAALSEAQGVIGTGLAFDRALIQASPQLKVISTISVGYDNYDLDALNQKAVLLCNTPDVLTESVADLSLALMLACARRVVELGSRVLAGEWKRAVDAADFGSDVFGKTLGIVGMGRIGMSVARRANLGFGMRVLYHSRHRKPDAERQFGARPCSLDELLAAADFVCVLVPLSAETDKLIAARQLARMKRSAFLINVARGRVIDEAALIDALKSRQIAGAGLDVFEHEPLPADSGLLGLPNVVLLPHIGSATHQTRLAMAERAVDNLIDALGGKKPLAMVNSECWPLRR